MPVSYTHLDVYKRQVVRMLPPPVLLAVQALWMFIGFGAAFWLTKAPLWPMLFASALMGDVYKRQFLNNAKTEREAAAEIEKRLVAAGYRPCLLYTSRCV